MLTTKIIAYEYDDDKLTGVAFIDTTLYVTEIKVAKNMIALFDIMKSVWFVVFQVMLFLNNILYVGGSTKIAIVK